MIGLIGSEGGLPRSYYGISCYWIHIHPSCVTLAYRSYPGGAVLVTDAMAQMGLPNGTYKWTNGKRITKEGMRLRLENEETIAGSFRGHILLT
jgi:N-acetylglucosamine-6-phosphate deacetylase